MHAWTDGRMEGWKDGWMAESRATSTNLQNILQVVFADGESATRYADGGRASEVPKTRRWIYKRKEEGLAF